MQACDRHKWVRGAAAWICLIFAGCASLQHSAKKQHLDLTADERAEATALAHYAQGLIFERQEGQSSKQALEHYTRAAELKSGHHFIYTKVATGCLLNGLHREAVAVLEKSCRESPSDFIARVDLATAYQLVGRADDAVDAYLKAIDLDSSRTAVYVAVANLLFHAKRDSEAITVLEDGMKESEQAEELRAFCYNRALRFIQNGQNDRSMACFHLVAKYAEAERGEVYHLMGQLFEGLGMRTEAIQSYEMATREPGPEPKSFIRLALLHFDDDPGRSLRILEDARRALPDNIVVLLVLGQIHSSQGRFEQAILTYEDILGVVARNPQHILTEAFYLQYGSACERSGNHQKAEQLFLSCLEQYPDADEVLNYLAYMWAEKGTSLDQALLYVNRALAQETDKPAYLDTRGWIYFQQGNYRAALTDIETASKLMPGDPTISDHLGDTWRALGDRARAIQHWKESYRGDSDNGPVADKLLANGINVQELSVDDEDDESPSGK